MRKFALIGLLAILPLGLSAARLLLRDGTTVYGNFISGTSQNIIFQDDNGVRRRFNLNQIQSLDFNEVNTSANRYNNNNSANRYDDRRNQNEWATLPAGTDISVRTDESIDSRNAVTGRLYPATMQRDIIDPNGNVLVPRGSRANLVIREVNEGGTLSSGNFVLDLDSIEANGRRYRVSTEDIEKSSSNGLGKNKRTAEMVGGGAVLGTLLGAIAGGGKGAAIGAVAGAAAGGGVQVLTKGHEIRVPAESVLNFRLDEPLHLREQ
ncbi:MAG TPA: hypothetical protein VGF59_05190 [Bryobacteraceae bacterium]|jgi:hypothetical protein